MSTEQVDFVKTLKSYVNQFDMAELKRVVKANDNKLTLRLDGNSVELVRGTHFFFNIKDKNTFAGN